MISRTPREKIIETLAHGTVVIILSTEDEWYKVKVNDKVGYVSSDYIDNVREYTASDDAGTAEQATNTPSGRYRMD